ncbi:MAG: prepilin-type N-terminal cleavage/methylation domain-containing protein [Planctomycetaceae bacterium]
MKTIRTTPQHPPRAAFSLVELLVVLSILLLLMGLAYVTLGQSGQKARVASTQTTLAQLDAVLQADFQAMLQDFTEQERKAAAKAEWDNLAAGRAALTSGAYGYSGTSSQLNAMVRQSRYIGLFPQRWEDTYGFDGVFDGWNPASAYVNTPDDSTQQASAADPMGMPPRPQIYAGPLEKRLKAALAKLSVIPAKSYADLVTEMTNPSAQNKNSELLYLLLTSSPNGTNLLDQIDADHVGDTDRDGFPEFVDDWGNPIRFYSTPTALFSVGADTSVEAALFPNVAAGGATGDPLDPTNALLTSVFAYPNGGDPLLYQPIPASAMFPSGIVYHHLGAYYAPLLVSAGPDESLGLVEPDSASGGDRRTLLCVPTVPDEAYDNITNYQGGN